MPTTFVSNPGIVTKIAPEATESPRDRQIFGILLSTLTIIVPFLPIMQFSIDQAAQLVEGRGPMPWIKAKLKWCKAKLQRCVPCRRIARQVSGR